MAGNVWDKLIVALDLSREREIKKVVDSLYPKVRKFKVGLIPYTALGPGIIRWIRKKGADVFLDLKFFDIPNTMLEAAKIALDLEIWAFTVHLKAGKGPLKFLEEKLKEEAEAKGRKRPLILGVTELTSKRTSLNKVLSLAKIAYESNLDGVICSVWEAKQIKDRFRLIAVTPGIRKVKADDQKRTATVKEAVSMGSDYFVVGRPIVKEKDFLKAAENILSL